MLGNYKYLHRVKYTLVYVVVFCRHELVLKDIDSSTTEELHSVYLNTWHESIIPLCSDHIKKAPHLCTEFRPSLTNHGICFTRNQGSLHDIYKMNPYIKGFENTFLHGRDQLAVQKNKGNGPRFKYSFMIDANRVMDLRKGPEWNDTEVAKFKLSIHSANDMSDTRNLAIDAAAGHKTVIKVNAIQLVSDESVRGIKIRKRGCRFNDENDNLALFKWYSR